MTGRQPGPSPGDGDGQGLSASLKPPPQEPQDSPSSGLGPPSESTPSLTPSRQGGCLPWVPPLPSPISLLTAGRVTFLKHHSPLLTAAGTPWSQEKALLLGLRSEALRSLAPAPSLPSSPVCPGPLCTLPLSCHFPTGPNSTSPAGLSLDVTSSLKPSLNCSPEG